MFKKGDRAICVNNIFNEDRLTLGYAYKIKNIISGYLLIINDNGRKDSFLEHRFVKSKNRKKKLERIID
jgi:hypothetical protein